MALPRWMIVAAAIVSGQFLAACADAQSPEPPPEIEVELTSGRLFRATVDARTEPSTLWLRFSRSAIGEMTILRPVAWDRITRVRHGGVEYSATDFQPLAEQLKTTTPRDVFPRRAPAEAVSHAAAAHPLPTRHTPSWPPRLEIAPLVVAHCDVDAYVANWDADVEVDGVALHVFPRSAEGFVLPTPATIEARLVARRANPNEISAPFLEIARWVERIEPASYGPGGALLRLPFLAVHPDFDTQVGPHALLHVKLIVPGHGVFETSVADLRIRPYSSLRDRLQHHENRRFFPGERTGRGLGGG